VTTRARHAHPAARSSFTLRGRSGTVPEVSADATTNSQSGFFQRIFRGSEPPPAEVSEPPAPPERLQRRRHGPEPIAAPAKGDAFSFQVVATYTWESDHLYPGELDLAIDRHTREVHHGLRELVIDVAHEVEPHRVAELQARLDAAVAPKRWHFDRDGVHRLSCRVEVRVAPDDRVRQRMQPYWERRIEMELEHELGMRRAELVEELTARWTTVLARLHEEPLTPHAARLTEAQFAEVFDRLISERRGALQDVVRILQDASRDHRESGLRQTEIVHTYDSLLRAVREQYDLAGESARQNDAADAPSAEGADDRSPSRPPSPRADPDSGGQAPR
jgi:hypothetical protein